MATLDSTNDPPVQPVFPPIDATMRVPSIVPFPAWTWNTPTVPQFYWNVYSAEQRIRQIAVEIGRLQAYLEYLAANTNAGFWYLDNRMTEVETRLTARVDQLESDLHDAVEELTDAIKEVSDGLATEIEHRAEGDANLQSNLNVETAARKTEDAKLKAAIDKEIADRQEQYDALDDKLAQEIRDRIAGDRELRTDLDTESATRESADTGLSNRITNEVSARQALDTRVSEGLNRRPTASNIKAAANSHINVVSTESSTGTSTVVISSDFDGDFGDLQSAIDTLAGKLEAETAARQAADTALQADVNTRLKPADIVAGANVSVAVGQNNTVTISSTATQEGEIIENITGVSPVTVDTDEDTHIVTVGLDEEKLVSDGPVADALADKADADSVVARVNGLRSSNDTSHAPVNYLTDSGASADHLDLTSATDTHTRLGVRVGNGLTGGSGVEINATGTGGLAADSTGLHVKADTTHGIQTTGAGVQAMIDDTHGVEFNSDGRIQAKIDTEHGMDVGSNGLRVNAGKGMFYDEDGSVGVVLGSGLTTDGNGRIATRPGEGLSNTAYGQIALKVGVVRIAVTADYTPMSLDPGESITLFTESGSGITLYGAVKLEDRVDVIEARKLSASITINTTSATSEEIVLHIVNISSETAVIAAHTFAVMTYLVD